MNSFLNVFRKEAGRASAGLVILRLAIGTIMIHHGFEKLADPATSRTAMLEPLAPLPFPNPDGNVGQPL